jgi:serine phosphatase RsbU (regulator of sigma subunit)
MPLRKSLISLSILLLLSLFVVTSIGNSSQRSFIYAVENPLHIVGALSQDSKHIGADVIAKLADHAFEETGPVPTFGFSDRRHWIKLKVFNFDSEYKNQILEVKSPILNICNLYESSGNGATQLFATGDSKLFRYRPKDHLNFQFPLSLAPNSHREFLLEVSSEGEQLQVPLALLNPDEISIRDEKDRLIRGVYFGIILFVLLFNLFLYIIIREKSSLYYVLYIFSLLVLQISLTGYGFRFFWPNSTYLANIANPFFASLSIFALIRFTQEFLNLKSFYPRLDKAFKISGHLVAINCLLALIYVPVIFKISVLAINVIALLLNIAIIPVVLLVLRKDFAPARYFLYAFIVLVASVFLFILNNFGVYRSDFYAAYGLQIGSAVEVVLLSFAIVDKFKKFREDAYKRLVTINQMKARANEELEVKVKSRTAEIIQQKQVVEKQKEEIVDSIRYAQRIQNSILPTEKEIKEIFPQNFVLFKPKDLVSGDFYWVGKTSPENEWSIGSGVELFAAVDCTGHGVPGALMSILGYNGLEECVNHPSVKSPADMLNLINNRIISSLQHDESGEVNMRDGMDIAIGAFNPKTRQLQFAGAKNNLYICRNNEMIELKADRKSIGAEFIESEGYTNREIQLLQGDRIYTFTDGFPDQFGGPRSKKFKSKNLLQTLVEYSELSMEEQVEALREKFETWRGGNEQIDDVCVIGIQIS